MPAGAKFHIVVVEAYQGGLELLSDDPAELAAAEGLGLPWDELAERVDCRVTILGWENWYAYESRRGSPFTWAARPATRPIARPGAPDPSRLFHSGRIDRVPVPARDPDSGKALASGLSPLSRGLVANRDLLFFVSYCLREELVRLARRDPFQLAVLPMWGGLGCLTQLSRATNAEGLLRVPQVVVATDPSSVRQKANQEGFWTKEAAMRRQMEEMSLALADEVLVFGPRGSSFATRWRLPERSAPIHAPRRWSPTVMETLTRAAERPRQGAKELRFFIHEPQQADAGVLCALDAVSILNRRGTRLNRPLAASGPDAIFAPMRPRSFREYWASRGFVRELIREKQWSWEKDRPRTEEGDSYFPVRIYPSSFEYLPSVWEELGRGSLVVLSAAAAEGLTAGQPLASEFFLHPETTPEALAAKMDQLARMSLEELDSLRRDLCRTLIEVHEGEARANRLRETAETFTRLLSSHRSPPPLGRASLLLLDRRRGLRELAGERPSPPPSGGPASLSPGLTVVVTCFRLGELLREAVESLWASRRRPEEVLVIDDGSDDLETVECLHELERRAVREGLPLGVIHQENRGLAGARNRGLAEASREYVSFLDGDDLVEPAFYELALPLLAEYPELGGVAAWARVFGEGVAPGFWNDPHPELPSLLVQNSVVVPCVSRTAVLRELGGYDSSLRYNYEDWELSIRLLATGRPIVTLPLFLVKYRVRRDSLLRTMTDVQNQIMRERLYSLHRESVSRFAVEISMLLEDRCGRLLYPPETRSASILERLMDIPEYWRRLWTR